MLERLCFDAACHHEPAMGITRHAVGTGRPIQRVENLRAIHAEFDTRRFQTGEEVHVSSEGPLAVAGRMPSHMPSPSRKPRS